MSDVRRLLRTSHLRPIAVPFTDDTIKVVAVHWSDVSGASIEIIAKRSGRACTVKFEHVAGLRMLHELDLASLWLEAENAALSSSWLFHVDSGGWLELESTRQDFYTQHELHKPREFLIAGFQECLSVLSFVEPSTHEHPLEGA